VVGPTEQDIVLALGEKPIATTPEGLNTEFLTYLGFRINPKVTALAKRPGEQVPISAEQLPIIDSDVLVFATDEATPTPRSAARCTSSAR
jgi:iron complex transport system substrate-binding protein